MVREDGWDGRSTPTLHTQILHTRDACCSFSCEGFTELLSIVMSNSLAGIIHAVCGNGGFCFGGTWNAWKLGGFHSPRACGCVKSVHWIGGISVRLVCA